MIGRRGFITGLVSLVAAPAIVRVSNIMPVRVMIEPPYGPTFIAIRSHWQEGMPYDIGAVVMEITGLMDVPRLWICEH